METYLLILQQSNVCRPLLKVNDRQHDLEGIPFLTTLHLHLAHTLRTTHAIVTVILRHAYTLF